MLKFQRIHEIDNDTFNRLYDSSAGILNSGSYPWHLYGNLSEEAKREIIYNGFRETIKKGIGWTVSKNENVLLLCAGSGIRSKHIVWCLGLSAPDETGSRSWLYDESYAIERNKFWEEVGVDGWIMLEASAEKDIHNHILSKFQTGLIKANVTIVPSKKEGYLDIIVTKCDGEGVLKIMKRKSTQ